MMLDVILQEMYVLRNDWYFLGGGPYWIFVFENLCLFAFFAEDLHFSVAASMQHIFIFRILKYENINVSIVKVWKDYHTFIKKMPKALRTQAFSALTNLHILYMTHSQMLGKIEYTLPAKFWRLVGCTEMLSW